MSRIIASLVVAGLFAATAAGQDKKPKAKFTISKETTYLTGPVDADGYIDYVAALNERLGKGVTAENNANALLWQAPGPKPERSSRDPVSPEFFRRMGIAVPPEQGEYLVPLFNYMREQLQLYSGSQMDAINEQERRAKERSWTADDSPQLAAWLKLNEKPLAMVLAATKRTRYFSPLVTNPASDLAGEINPGIQGCREFARALSIRATLRTGTGAIDLAWEDLLACHRLGRLVTQDGNMVDWLFGIAIDSIAFHADKAFLSDANLSAAQLDKCLKDLQGLPPRGSCRHITDLRERLLVLDTTMRLHLEFFEAFRSFGGILEVDNKKVDNKKLEQLKKMSLDGIDWDVALTETNRRFDRIAAIMREKDHAKRETRLDEIAAEMNDLEVKLICEGTRDPRTTGDARARGTVVGDLQFILSISALRKMQEASDRAQQTQDNNFIAFALARYKRDCQRYPPELAALAPKYLPEIPQDLFSGKPLIYKPSANGYLLYSVGPNGKDDGGRGFGDEPQGDDIVVRMPLPELKRK